MHVLHLLRNLPGILPHTRFANNRHVLFLLIKNCPTITETDIKYCCNTVHAVNFRRELVLENATSGFLKVLENSLNFTTKI